MGRWYLALLEVLLIERGAKLLRLLPGEIPCLTRASLDR